MIDVLIDLYLISAVLAVTAVHTGRYWYRGRHHTDGGLSTMEWIDYRNSLAVPVDEVPAAEVPQVAPKAGVGRYAHLRTEELETTAEHLRLLADLGIAVPRLPWVVPDEWTAEELAGVAT